MKKLLIALAALPFMAGAAAAGQPLNDRQMDSVTAGYTALAFSDAQGLAGESGIVTTYTATLSLVTPYATATFGEARGTLYKAVSAAQSSTVTDTFSPSPIPTQVVTPPPAGG